MNVLINTKELIAINKINTTKNVNAGAIIVTPKRQLLAQKTLCNVQIRLRVQFPARRCPVTTLGKVVYTHVPQQVAVI